MSNPNDEDQPGPAADAERPWRFFHAVTGVLQRGSMLLPNATAVADNTPADHVATQVEADPATQRIDVATGLPVPYMPDPAAQVLDAPTARAQRDLLLAGCDWVVTRAMEQGGGVPALWAAYRAALRDLPAQAGFPSLIDWPTPPST